MVGYEEKALCRKIARMFEIAGKRGYSVQDLSEKWLCSDTALRIFNKDFNEIAQSPVYVLNSLSMEKSVYKDGSGEKYEELLFWLGYIITYIEFFTNLTPREVWNKYDIIRFAESYDVLHTLSSKRAAEECIEEFHR